jgi:hypothetical protein
MSIINHNPSDVVTIDWEKVKQNGLDRMEAHAKNWHRGPVLPLWAVKALQDLGYGERNYTKVFNRDPDVWMRNQENNVPER